jgi:hypothetical protein
MAIIPKGSLTVAIKVCFSFNFAVVFAFQVFPVPPSKGNSIGNFLTNRQNAATWYMFFFLLFNNAHCLLTQRIILHYNAMHGEEGKKIAI